MKKVVLFTLVITLLLLSVSSCHQNAEISLEEVFTQYTEEEVIEYIINNTENSEDYTIASKIILSKYSEDQIVDYVVANATPYMIYNALAGIGTIYPPIICEEIESQNVTEEFENLFTLAEKIGYNPSMILGSYCLDKETNIIHKTDSDCIQAIHHTNMSFIALNSSEKLSLAMIDEGSHLNNCTLCSECFLAD